MSEDNLKSFINYKSADIYFIFSFLFELKEKYHGIATELIKKENGWIEGVPEDRKGRPPFLAIKRPLPDKKNENKISRYISTSLYKNLSESTHQLSYKENGSLNKFDVSLKKVVRLFDNGSGCITYKVNLSQSVSLRNIHHILSLSQRHFDHEKGGTVLKNGDGEEQLCELFVEDIKHLESNINGGKKRVFVELQDKYVMDLNCKKMAPQNPYVFTVLEIYSSSKERLFSQYTAESNTDDGIQQKELATVLLRMVYPDKFFAEELRENIMSTRIPHELRDSIGNIKNYSWDSRILMYFSRVSSLFVCKDKSVQPESFLRNSLLDTVELLRTRWHMSILLNALLDQDMEAISDKASSENVKALKRIIERRRQFASFLNDPLPYNFEGGSAVQIIEVAERDMWLKKLRDMTYKKLGILDKLYEDQMQYIAISNFGDYKRDMQKLQEKVKDYSGFMRDETE